MKSVSFLTKSALIICITSGASVTAFSQSAGTWVDVGPGHAGAGGSASGTFQHVDTNTRVGLGGNVAHGVAIGAGPNGFAISHSIGVNGGGRGAAHNFNLSVGPNGTHVSHGNVNSVGGNSRVIAGGSTNVGSPWISPNGGSHVTGFGHQTYTNTYAETRSMRPPFPPLPRRAFRSGPFGASPIGSPIGPFGR